MTRAEFICQTRELALRYAVTLLPVASTGDYQKIYLCTDVERTLIGKRYDRDRALDMAETWLIKHIASQNPDGDALARLGQR